MYVTIIIKLSDGSLVETHKRNRRLAAVNHLEWQSAPGFRLDNGTEQKPLETASHISYKYCWSVLRSEAVIGDRSDSIGVKTTIGSFSQTDIAVPILPLKAWRPDVAPSRNISKWRSFRTDFQVIFSPHIKLHNVTIMLARHSLKVHQTNRIQDSSHLS